MGGHFWDRRRGLGLEGGGGGGGRALVVQLQDMNTVHGRTVFWTMLCVLVLGSTSVDVPLIFEPCDPELHKIHNIQGNDSGVQNLNSIHVTYV